MDPTMTSQIDSSANTDLILVLLGRMSLLGWLIPGHSTPSFVSGLAPSEADFLQISVCVRLRRRKLFEPVVNHINRVFADQGTPQNSPLVDKENCGKTRVRG